MSLSSFLGVSERFLDLHYQKTKEDLYLHIKKTVKVLKIEPTSMEWSF